MIKPRGANGDIIQTQRNLTPSPLRLIQVDFAVADQRSEVGWVFGTFVYDEDRTDDNVSSVNVMVI
jgi:hypothetical protein